jgi:diacylglycerol kinase family enzyme
MSLEAQLDDEPTRPQRVRTAVVLLNAAAGSLAGRTLAEEMTRVADAFHAAGVVAKVRAVEGEGITDVARAALASDTDAVVVGGGDGTVSAAVRGLVGGEKPLGVLALGTFNHFAKDLGMPLDLDDAARVIAGGFVRRIDVGEVNGRTFVNNSVLGLYTGVVRERDSQRKQMGRNRWVALGRAAVTAFRRFPMVEVEIESDGDSVRRTTPFVFIGNNDYELPLFPSGGRSCLEDGRLCLYVARATGRVRMVGTALRALVGGLRESEDLERMRTAAVVIRSRKRRLRVLLDGEVVYLEPPLRYRTRPRALRVLVPPPEDEGLPA